MSVSVWPTSVTFWPHTVHSQWMEGKIRSVEKCVCTSWCLNIAYFWSSQQWCYTTGLPCIPPTHPGSPVLHLSLLWQQQAHPTSTWPSQHFCTPLHWGCAWHSVEYSALHTPVINNTQFSYSRTNRLPTQLLSQVWPTHPLLPLATLVTMICIWRDCHYEALRVTTRLHLTGREALGDTEREWIALTARNGELGIPHPLQLAFISLLPAHQWQLPSGAHPPTEHQLPCWCTSETGTGKGHHSHQHRSDATTEEMAMKPLQPPQAYVQGRSCLKTAFLLIQSAVVSVWTEILCHVHQVHLTTPGPHPTGGPPLM